MVVRYNSRIQMISERYKITMYLVCVSVVLKIQAGLAYALYAMKNRYMLHYGSAIEEHWQFR